MTSLVNILPKCSRPVAELVVISGKGGTGKTSIVAWFAALARNSVLADCDVDAADLHLLASPRVVRRESFSGGKRAKIDANVCTVCGQCEDLCRFDAIRLNGPKNFDLEATFQVDQLACEGCGVCAWFCPLQAIDLSPVVNGEWFVSETRFGPLVHARLGIAEDNSGKLVSLIRTTATQVAEERNLDLVIIDGAPGIGCPVIASITGAGMALVVTEATVSGLHDMERVAKLTRHFGIPSAVCVNKWDLNPEICDVIEAKALHQGMALAGRVRYDSSVTEAQVQGRAIVEFREDASAEDIREVWGNLEILRIKATPSPDHNLSPGKLLSDGKLQHSHFNHGDL